MHFIYAHISLHIDFVNKGRCFYKWKILEEESISNPLSSNLFFSNNNINSYLAQKMNETLESGL